MTQPTVHVRTRGTRRIGPVPAYDGPVSEQQAGWYPDPEGQNRQRFWDGDSWTEYYAPLVPTRQEVHDTSTARSDYPYLSQNRHPDIMVAPGALHSNLHPGTSPWGRDEPRMEGPTQVLGAGVRGTT